MYLSTTDESDLPNSAWAIIDKRQDRAAGAPQD
jgi:hypothetical protein